MKNTNKFIFILILLLTLACKNQENNIITESIKNIDNIPISETIYILDVDSDKNVLDTIALRELKFDTDKNLIFEKNFQLKYNLETVNYYTENGLIYSKIKKDDEIISEFRVNMENELIVSAQQVSYHNSTKDSDFMKYHYTFDKGKKIRLLIDLGDNYKTIELYNELEKPVLNFLRHERDTLEKTELFYDKNNVLKKKRFKNFSQSEEVIYEYDNGFIVRESFLKNGIEEFDTDYYKDKNGNYLRHTKRIIKD